MATTPELEKWIKPNGISLSKKLVDQHKSSLNFGVCLNVVLQMVSTEPLNSAIFIAVKILKPLEGMKNYHDSE